MIYNARYILPGLLAFIGLLTLPFWLGMGKEYTRVKPTLPPSSVATACIEPRAVMAASHMTLLNAWRDAALRENRRQYTASDGKVWTISLTGTCLSCHTDKAAFCDTCHKAVGVTPYCWDCHSFPQNVSQSLPKSSQEMP